MSRLESHRRNFELNDRRGDLLRLDELTADEVGMVNSTFFERVHKEPPEDLDSMYKVYIETLHEWGIMCPHPVERRRFSLCNRWYDCALCQATVINC